MTNQPQTTIQEDLDRRAELKAQIETLDFEVKLIENRLRESFDYGSHPVGDYRVRIDHNRRMDTSAIESTHPVERFPHLYKAVINTAAVKDYFAPVDLEKFYVEGAPKLVVQ